MLTGISTASFFGKMYTEESAQLLAERDIPVAEVFLTTFSEYDADYAKDLKKRLGATVVHSVHSMTTQFEPQLFNYQDRTRRDSEIILESFLQAGEILGAKYYTFHGPAQLKKTKYVFDYPAIGKRMHELTQIADRYGITIAYENVHWANYNFVGYFKQISEYAPLLRATLDIKQAVQAQIDYRDLIAEMGSKLVTVHLSDCYTNGEVVMIGRGDVKFDEVIGNLYDSGYDGVVLLELYAKNYREYDEVFRAYDTIRETVYRVTGKID